MTSQGNGSAYEVKLSHYLKSVIKELYQQADLQGKGQQFLLSLRAIHDRLRRDARDFGEPLYRLPTLKLMVYQVIVLPVVVTYVVHEEKPLVFLKTVKLLD
jgi:hypothetical protein